MVPVPHRNTINFLGMQPKYNYLIWREVNGIFTALDKQGEVRAWVIWTGKSIKPLITVGNIDVNNFSLYEFNESDDTYKHNWQQYPEQSVALLRAKENLEYYDFISESMLTEN